MDWVHLGGFLLYLEVVENHRYRLEVVEDCWYCLTLVVQVDRDVPVPFLLVVGLMSCTALASVFERHPIQLNRVLYMFEPYS